MADTRESIIKERRHPLIEEKLAIWQLLDDSYAGGQQYIDGGHLVKYIRESNNQYHARIKRSTYFNHIQPLVDLFVGFIFSRKPNRENSEKFSHIIKDIASGQDMNEFMMNVATQAMMMVCGVLVESPRYDSEKIKTKRDRLDSELNPYCVFYHPGRIRDFSVDAKGNLLWILLDNSYTDNFNPYVEPKEVTVYRLWTREYYQDFVYDGENGEEEKEIQHDLKEVPFIFVNLRDKDQEKIADTIFEDIALYDKAIYNFMSCMDEMIVGGTFKLLFYPVDDVEEDMPKEILTGGVSSLAVVAFNGRNGTPFFDGPGLQDADPFIHSIEMYFSEIMKKVGVEEAEKQSIVKTGVARRYDFEKTKAYLESGIRQLIKVEEKIFDLIAKYEGDSSTKTPNVVYYKDFLEEDLDAKLTRYFRLLALPYEMLSKVLHKLIVKASISNEVTTDDLDKILKEIETYKEEPPLNPEDLVNKYKGNTGE